MKLFGEKNFSVKEDNNIFTCVFKGLKMEFSGYNKISFCKIYNTYKSYTDKSHPDYHSWHNK